MLRPQVKVIKKMQGWIIPPPKETTKSREEFILFTGTMPTLRFPYHFLGRGSYYLMPP